MYIKYCNREIQQAPSKKQRNEKMKNEKINALIINADGLVHAIADIAEIFEFVDDAKLSTQTHICGWGTEFDAEVRDVYQHPYCAWSFVLPIGVSLADAKAYIDQYRA